MSNIFKIALVGLVATMSIGAADARDPYRDGRAYERPNYQRGYVAPPPPRYDRYERRDRHESRRDYERRVEHERRMREDKRYRKRHQRCSGGTGGALIGGAAGAVLGSEVAGRGDSTLGAIAGGLLGAAVGREISRDCR